MTPLLLFLLVVPSAKAATRFEDLIQRTFENSDQSQIIAQDRERLSLENEIALGSMYDPTLKASYFNQFEGFYQNRRWDVNLAQRTSLWGSQVSFGYRKGVGSFPVYDSKWLTQDDGELRLGIEIPLLRNGWIDSLRGGVKKGELSAKLSEAQQKSQNLDLLKSLGQRYWDWYANGAKLKIADELLRLSIDRQNKIKSRAEKGDIARIEVLEGERIILQRKSTKAAQERSFLRSKIELTTLLASRSDNVELNLNPDQVPDYSLPDATEVRKKWASASTEILGTHPEETRQGLLLEQAKVDSDVARNQFLPKLDLSVNVSKDIGTPTYSLSPLQNEAGLSFEFPLPSRAASSRKSQANSLVMRQEAQVHLTQERIQNQLIDAKGALEFALERMLLANEELELAKKLVEMENRRFLSGDSNLITLNIREQNLSEAQIRRVESLAEYRKSIIDFNTAKGVLDWNE